MSAPRVAVIATVLLVGLPAAVGALAPHASLALVSPLPSASLPVPLPSLSPPAPLPSASVPLPSVPLPSASVSLPTPSLPLPTPSESPGVSLPPLPGTSLPPLPSASLGGLPSLSPLGSASPGPTNGDEIDTTDGAGAGAGGADSDGGLGSAFQALNDFLEIGLPAVAIGIPVLLALGVLAAQLVGGASLMPLVRRTLGGIGLGRFVPRVGPALPAPPPAASDPPGRRG